MRKLIIASLLLASSNPAAGEPGASVQFNALYTAEYWDNRSGGLGRGDVYLDNLDVTIELDAEALWDLEATRIYLYGLYNNGNDLSGVIVGDLQVVSNIETGVEAARLYEAWIETSLTDRASLLFGLYDLNSEFDVIDSSALFVNSAHGIGTDIGQSGIAGPSIFPVTSLAARLHLRLDDVYSLRVGVLDGVPGDPEDPGATEISLSGDDGALLIAELDRNRNRSRLLLGAWHYTADFERWSDGVEASGNGGIYLRGELALGDETSPVTVFGRVGTAAGNFNIFSAFYSVGIHWRGPFAARPDDELGVAIAVADTSSTFAAAQNGIDIEDAEVACELTYRLPLTKRVTLQPDIQYTVNPGLDSALENAWTIGLRLELDLSR